MKKIILLLISMQTFTFAFAQQTQLTEAISIEIPKDAEKLTKDKAIKHVDEKFHHNRILFNLIVDEKGDHTYKVGNILVTFHPFNEHLKLKDDYLFSLKRGADARFSGDTSYSADLKKVNGNNILIKNYILQGVAYCNFFCLNTNNDREVTGMLEFDPADSTKAKIVLDKLLKSIKFKD